MKKLCLMVAVMVLIAPALSFGAEEISKTFTWTQADVDLPYIDRWVAECQESGQSVDFIYDGSAGPFRSTKPLVINGTPGTAVVRTFRLRAISKGGQTTAYSNAIAHTFNLSEPTISVPVFLSIE